MSSTDVLSALLVVDQVAEATRIEHDVTGARHRGERRFSGNECAALGDVGCRGQDGIGGADAGSLFEQAQAFTQLGFLDDEQWRVLVADALSQLSPQWRDSW
jgi:hypothetical protein